jgi:hypothetical protein
MRPYRARAEFRRRDLTAGWVLSGVFIDHVFFPARFGVERLRGRLAGPGLAGWTDLPEPILAPDAQTAAEIALDVARQRWPKRDCDRIPFATGRAG